MPGPRATFSGRSRPTGPPAPAVAARRAARAEVLDARRADDRDAFPGNWVERSARLRVPSEGSAGDRQAGAGGGDKVAAPHQTQARERIELAPRPVVPQSPGLDGRRPRTSTALLSSRHRACGPRRPGRSCHVEPRLVRPRRDVLRDATVRPRTSSGNHRIAESRECLAARGSVGLRKCRPVGGACWRSGGPKRTPRPALSLPRGTPAADSAPCRHRRRADLIAGSRGDDPPGREKGESRCPRCVGTSCGGTRCGP